MTKSIWIEVVDRQDVNGCAIGKITLEEFSERFEMALDWWDVEDYIDQWRIGLERLKDHDQSCLIASINDPQKRPYINWWLLYKKSGKIYAQNQIIIGEIYDEMVGKEPFTLVTCYDFIPSRYCEEKVSEWVVDYY